MYCILEIIALERVVNRGNHVVQRLTNRHNQPQVEPTDDTSSNRPIKPTESNDCLTGISVCGE